MKKTHPVLLQLLARASLATRALVGACLVAAGVSGVGCSSGSPDDSAADADPAECADVSGAYAWTPCGNLPSQSCITQSGCAASLSESQGPLTETRVSSGTVDGSTLTSVLSDGGGSVTCTYVFTGETATLSCTGSVACTATGTRVTLPGATSYCCDVAHSDCGTGQRCTPFSSIAVATQAYTACAPDGTIGEGDACTRADGRIGADECEAGLTCVNLEQVSTDTRICQRLCTNGSDCNDDEHCYEYGTTPHMGVCRTACTPLATDCAAGTTCRTVFTWTATGTATDREVAQGVCDSVGSSTEGASCAVATDCAADLDCIGSVCERICSSASPCPSDGPSCSPISGMNPEGLGVCTGS